MSHWTAWFRDWEHTDSRWAPATTWPRRHWAQREAEEIQAAMPFADIRVRPVDFDQGDDRVILTPPSD